MTTFSLSNTSPQPQVYGPAGSLQRARLYAPDGSTVTDLALTESPAGTFSGSITISPTVSAYTSPFQYEVRQVSVQTSLAFTNSTLVTVSRGDYAYQLPGSTPAPKVLTPEDPSVVIYQNSPRTLAWDATGEDSSPLDRTGHVFFLVIHEPDTDNVATILNTSAFSLQASNPSLPSLLDRIVFTVPASVGAALSPDVYAYKLWDMTEQKVYASGPLTVQWAPLPP